MRVHILTLGFSIVTIFAISHDVLIFQEGGKLKTVLFGCTFLALLFCAMVVLGRSWPRRVLAIRPNALLLSYLAGLAGVQLVVHHLSGGHLVRLAGYLLVAPIAYSLLPFGMIQDRRALYAFLRVIAWASGFLSLTAVLTVFGVQDIMGLPLSVKQFAAYRMFGVYATGGLTGHPLTLGTQAFFGLCCAVFLLRQEKSVWLVVLFALNLCGLLLSMSRGAWLSVAIASYYWFAPKQLAKSRVVMFVLLPALITGMMVVFFQIAMESPFLVHALRLGMGMSDRQVLWGYGLELIQQKPWVGYGLLSSGDLISQAGLAQALNLRPDTPFHNTFLDSAIYSGLGVTAVYLLMFIVPLYRCVAVPRDSREDLITKKFLVGMGLGVAVSSFFLNYNIGGLRLPSITLAIFLGSANWFSFTGAQPVEDRPRAFKPALA